MKNLFAYLTVLTAALITRSGSFFVTVLGKRYLVSVVEAPHVTPLGGFSLVQAISLATQFASGASNLVLRVGADDYNFSVVQVG